MTYLLWIAYKGTNYAGFQVQPNALTVCEVLHAHHLTAHVELHDRGALDWIIRARLETALARAQEDGI